MIDRILDTFVGDDILARTLARMHFYPEVLILCASLFLASVIITIVVWRPMVRAHGDNHWTGIFMVFMTLGAMMLMLTLSISWGLVTSVDKANQIRATLNSDDACVWVNKYREIAIHKHPKEFVSALGREWPALDYDEFPRTLIRGFREGYVDSVVAILAREGYDLSQVPACTTPVVKSQAS